MEQYFNQLGLLGQIYLLCAITGGTAFMAQLLLQFFTGNGDDIDPGDLISNHYSDFSFKLLSIQTLSAFLMMFGLVGLGLYGKPVLSLGLATLAGIGSVLAIRQMFQLAMSFQSSGTLKLENAIGKEGTTYLTIQPSQIGKVQLTVQGRFLTIDAISESPELTIKTGTPVIVTRVQNNILVVKPLSNF